MQSVVEVSPSIGSKAPQSNEELFLLIKVDI